MAELKKAYKRTLMANHSDKGGGDAAEKLHRAMQAITMMKSLHSVEALENEEAIEISSGSSDEEDDDDDESARGDSNIDPSRHDEAEDDSKPASSASPSVGGREGGVDSHKEQDEERAQPLIGAWAEQDQPSVGTKHETDQPSSEYAEYISVCVKDKFWFAARVTGLNFVYPEGNDEDELLMYHLEYNDGDEEDLAEEDVKLLKFEDEISASFRQNTATSGRLSGRNSP